MSFDPANPTDSPWGPPAIPPAPSIPKGSSYIWASIALALWTMGGIESTLGCILNSSDNEQKVNKYLQEWSKELSELQLGSGPDGYNHNDPNAMKTLIAQMQATWHNLFGSTTFDAQGNPVNIDPNSAFGSLVAELKAKEGANYVNDPMYANTVAVGGGAWNMSVPDCNDNKNFGPYNFGQLVADNSSGQLGACINSMAEYYYDVKNSQQNQGVTPVDYVSQQQTDTGAAEAPFTAQNTQDTQQISTYTSSETSIKQTVSSMLDSFSDLIKAILNNTKS